TEEPQLRQTAAHLVPPPAWPKIRTPGFDIRRLGIDNTVNDRAASTRHPMRSVTFQVVEGVDKGRVYRDLSVPVSIGREEGNGLRLNDERVSRFHAKIQFDGDDVIMTDLESTNGTRINGDPVQIRRLQAGDRVSL